MTKTLLKTLLLPVIAFVFITDINAQSGAFGHFFAGPAIGNFSRLQRDLQQFHFLGQDFGMATTGFTIGGGGMYSMNDLLMGGNGFYSNFGSAVSARGQAEVSTGAGFFNLGYAMHNANGWMLYPYAGVGGSKTTLKITNETNGPFSFGSQTTVQPGETGDFNVSGIALEGGVGLQKLVARKDHKSGFVVGLQFGTYGHPNFRAWSPAGSDRTVTGITATHAQAYYVRFSFGGGWF